MKKFKNILIFILLFFFLIQIFLNIKVVQNSINLSFIVFKNRVFPNLFPFLILSGLLINYGFIDFCNATFGKFMKKLFNISGNASFIFFMSLFTGFPSNSKYTKDLYEKGYITLDEANRILTFTHFSNPLFIIGTVGQFLSYKIALLILLSHYLGNIIIGICFKKKVSNKHTYQTSKQILPFGLCLANSIKNSLDTLLLIFGTITTFFIVTSIIDSMIVVSPLFQTIINGLLEMTQGIEYVNMLNISIKFKAILIVMFISFGGISVHTQVLSIISDTNIKYKGFLISRIFHSLISGLILYLLL